MKCKGERHIELKHKTVRRRILSFIEIVYIFFLVLGTFLYLLSKDLCHAQSSKRDEILINVRPVTTITSDVTPSECRFETNVVVSKYYLNQYDHAVNLSISEEVIGWGSHPGFEVFDITIFDNLGNSFEPVIENGIISNPKSNVVLPPSFEYKLSLSLYTFGGIAFDDDKLEYLLQFDLGYPRQATISVRFPSNFTVLACNIYSPFSPEVIISEEYPYVIARWDIPENAAMKIYVPFLPFCVQGVIRSYKFTVDIPNVFPIKGGIRGTIEEVFQTSATFSIWEIDPVAATYIDFPKYATPISVESVWDSDGECEEILAEVDNPDESHLGCYFVDNKNRKVIVYSRYRRLGDTYEYRIGATFFTGHEYETYKMEGIKEQWWPFRYESYLLIDDITLHKHWRMNLTGDVEVKFILPEGSEPLIPESGNPLIDTEGNRPVGRFIYSSIEEIYQGSWRVVYDITSLKNFFILEVVSIAVLVTFFVGSFRLSEKMRIQVVRIVFSLLILSNLVYLVNLGAFKTFFIALFLIEVLISILIFFVSNKKLSSN